ncbi:MAG: hypothetical protein RIS90_33 [Pseudomonadota bacterium]
MARAIDTASVSANSATATATGSRLRKVSSEKSGLDKGGKPMRNEPRLVIAVCSAPNH